jgi:V8-like Glu-specific endopeptidase
VEWSADAIRNLREILAPIYLSIDEVRRVLTDAGLDSTRIALDRQAITTWFNILEHARHRDGKIEAILEVALKDYPDNRALQRARDQAPPPVLAGPEVKDWRGPAAASQLEKLMALRSSLVPVSYLEKGTLCARSVVRIVTADGSSGTGFVVAGDLLITNHHVLPNSAVAGDAVIEFNYQQTMEGLDAPVEQFRLEPTILFKTSLEDDWTAVKIAGAPSAKWGALELKPMPVKVGDHVNIIQHAGGGPKQVSFIANVVAYVGGGRIQYLTDTLPGSSGSPVFDTSWNLVALHHSGGWLAEPNAPSKATYYRNQGILLERMIAGLV